MPTSKRNYTRQLLVHTFQRLRVENETSRRNSALGVTDVFSNESRAVQRCAAQDSLQYVWEERVLVPRPTPFGVELAGMGLHVLT